MDVDDDDDDNYYRTTTLILSSCGSDDTQDKEEIHTPVLNDPYGFVGVNTENLIIRRIQFRLKTIMLISKRQVKALVDRIISPISRTPFGRRRTQRNKISKEK
ncbi:hypothetical protein C5167_042318 [Papaver somniferum]|uniref:Uncharacterized protein n=1 Tax=Papaver somniferum TaxID=3469 RepID=A0A4Y7L5T8_PAPSO|nr:hypothetical protein C5167_042318 [Papaver somniferum]